jgi:hypothetical protein
MMKVLCNLPPTSTTSAAKLVPCVSLVDDALEACDGTELSALAAPADPAKIAIAANVAFTVTLPNPDQLPLWVDYQIRNAPTKKTPSSIEII